MHRFRKRSDVKRNQTPDFGDPPPPPPVGEGSSEQLDFNLPPTDFRTSLILPDLSRRFSLLRTSGGDPVTFDDLRSKFAEQRAKGADHTISEEEEEMLLETLGKLRGRAFGGHAADRSEESFTASVSEVTEESGSNSSTTIKLTKGGSSSAGSSPARSKRYSNNLFGSGRLREYNYLRTVSASRNSAGGSSKTASITPSEESSNFRANTTSFTDSITSSSPPPTGSVADDSVLSLPSTSANDQGSVRSTSSSVNEAISAAEYRLQKNLGPVGLKRASMALENVIKEIEDEEVEEEIVMPRSTPIPRNHTDQPSYQNNGQQQKQPEEGFGRDSDASMLSSVIEAGMAISSDKPSDEESESNAQRGPSPVPLGVTPGYIPGMPRPMTPRDFESFDEQRSHSTTPRATSPMHGSFTLSEAGSASAISNILRRDSASARQSPRPITPLFLQRSTHGAHHSMSSHSSTSPTNGRFTPVDDSRSRIATDLTSSTDFDNSLSSSILGGRRRPASPLTNPPYHAISAMASSNGGSPSRPTTPSNIIWGVKPDASTSPSSSSDRPGHGRDNSWASEGDSDAYGSGMGETDSEANGSLGGLGVYKLGANGANRPLRSPPRSDSPGPEKGQLSRSWSFKNATSTAVRSMLPVNGVVNGENGHQYQASAQRNHRSITPTQNAPRSPGSPTFGSLDSASSRMTKRSSRQNGYGSSSPFNLGPLPTLTLNPKANMSSSSLESAGSSFHSWEGEKDKVLTIFNDAETQPAWHEFSPLSSDKSSSTGTNGTDNTSRTSPEEGWDPEDIIRGYAGLKKGDFAMIQEKLVAVAKVTENRSSAMRKRRPSTSQSNYSVRDNRQVGSPPQPVSPTLHVHSNAREQQQIHVLNTCVEPQAVSAPGLASSNSSSSIDRPNRNLARVLFGQDEDTTDTEGPVSGAAITESDRPDVFSVPLSLSLSQQSDTSTNHGARPSSPNVNGHSPTTPDALTLNRNPSSARLPPQTPQEQAALVLEVQQKVQAATLALRKHPSHEGLNHSPSVSKKKIDPSQISKPLFVSSSTSVDTIPLKTPALSASNSSGPSKIGSRFKKLRGSLRAKSNLVDESSVPQIQEPKVSPNANDDPERLKSPGTPSISSATESGRFKASVPSPPASANPGLKGFMARFRTKRGSEVPQSSSSSISSDHHHLPASPLSPLAQSHRQFSSSSTQSRAPSHSATSESGHSATTPRQDSYRGFSNNIIATPQSPPQSLPPPSLPPTSEVTETDDNTAILQLFAAANNLGIDQGAINELLKRSGSLATRTLLNPTHDGPNTQGTRGIPPGNPHGHHLTVPPIQQPNLSSSSGSDHTATPGMFNSSPVSDLSIGNNFSYPEEPLTPDEPTPKAPQKRADHLRRAKDINNEANPVVRRTLIFADPRQSTVDPTMSRKSTMRRRRASVQSASNRSIHDRVPTPPPSKTPQGKRFSHEASPPVPQLPHALGGPENSNLHVPLGHTDKAHSAAYDSLYELYGDSRSTSMMVDPSNPDFGKDAPMNPETATGVEVIQLANGDIIWNVVNGLRDDDDESLYTGRNSMGSEYSARESGENMQVFVKEHIRASSKGSNASFASRKKTLGGKPRPETKVLYGSPEQIGRLIESVSQGMDAGSFNFSSPGYTGRSNTQGNGQGHSATSSLSTNDWAINEIDNILTSINRP